MVERVETVEKKEDKMEVVLKNQRHQRLKGKGVFRRAG